MHLKVGIDLGTTYSVVAKFNPATSSAEVVPNKEGKDLTPSVICFMDGETLIGEEAKDMQISGTGEAVSVFKRGIGNPNFYVNACARQYSAEDLSSIMYKALADSAEDTAGEKIDGTVITVPAYFNDIQRKAALNAAQKAGIKVLKIMNEPTAAAIYYGHRHSANKTLMVYDLGGGTFDVTVVRVSEGKIDVLGTAGNHVLGGKDWDEALMNIVCDRFYDQFGTDPREDMSRREEILARCESYKKLLSTSRVVRVDIEFGGVRGYYTVTREDFESKTTYLLAATDDVMDSVLKDLELIPTAVDEVLLVGGSTRMPQVSEFLKSRGFPCIKTYLDTDLAVAKGAAIYAGQYDAAGKDAIAVKDVTAHSLGMLSVGPDHRNYVNEIMIPKNSLMPATKRKTYRIEEDNLTDQVEVFVLQGESAVPTDCIVIAKDVITGFENTGHGIDLVITFGYDDNGVVHVSAQCGGQNLTVIIEDVPSDTEWMSRSPSEKKTNARVAKNIAICVDLSRSMANYLDDVANAAKRFVTSLEGDFTKFALIGFGDRVKVLSPLSADTNDILSGLDRLRVNRFGRGTNADPIETVEEVLGRERGVKIGLILTDGVWGNRNIAVRSAAACRKKKISLVAIGFGDVDASFLKQIATLEKNAVYTTLGNLGKTVNTIATVIRDTPEGLMERFK